MNNNVSITYISKHVFDLAIMLALTSEYEPEKKETIIGYAIHNNMLFLYTHEPSDKLTGYSSFPYKLNVGLITAFAWGWLEQSKPTQGQPDTDGSVEKGFTITTEGCDWRGGSKFYGSIISIYPSWIIYGK